MNRFDQWKGFLSLFFITTNLSFWCCPLSVLGLVKTLVPSRRSSRFVNRLMSGIYRLAVRFDDAIFFSFLGITVEAEGIEGPYPPGVYLLVANHQTWNDIFILRHVFTRKAPLLKFLVKRELLHLPIVGLICWAYDFPFLARAGRKGSGERGKGRKKNVGSLRKAVVTLGENPASLVNFVEGTRFSRDKAKLQRSPYAHLLKPRAGGLAFLLQALGDRLLAVLDITIVYDPVTPTFWDFLCGRCRKIIVRNRSIPPGEILRAEALENSEQAFALTARWVNRLWERKDREIASLRQGLAAGEGN